MVTGTHSVLIIEEDAEIREALTEYFTKRHFVVVAVSDGRRGVAALEQQGFSLAIIDVDSRDDYGAPLIARLSREVRELPIIATTWRQDWDELIEVLRSSAADLLVKPITQPRQLDAAVQRCLERMALVAQNLRYRRKLEATNNELQQSLGVLQQDQLAGRYVQMKMLPETPKQFEGYRLTHQVVPSLYLSGDFVDYFTVGERYIAFFMADVSGHGASSAFVTVLLKNLFARKRSDFLHRNDPSILSPAMMLAKANRELLGTDIGKHATVICAVIDTRESSLLYSVAGHLPLPILITDEGSRYLPGQAMPVGLFEHAQYPEHLLALPESFTLLLFSDGILETISGEKSLQEKENYLLEVLHTAPQTMIELSGRLGLDEVHEAPDDIAVLMISRGE